MGLLIEALRVVPITDSHTGIVIAGFGKDQYFRCYYTTSLTMLWLTK